jgi:hypothetical protein
VKVDREADAKKAHKAQREEGNGEELITGDERINRENQREKSAKCGDDHGGVAQLLVAARAMKSVKGLYVHEVTSIIVCELICEA